MPVTVAAVKWIDGTEGWCCKDHRQGRVPIVCDTTWHAHKPQHKGEDVIAHRNVDWIEYVRKITVNTWNSSTAAQHHAINNMYLWPWGKADPKSKVRVCQVCEVPEDACKRPVKAVARSD